MVKTCLFDTPIKSMPSEQTEISDQTSKRQEDTPMEVSSNPPSTEVFKVRYPLLFEEEIFKYLLEKYGL